MIDLPSFPRVVVQLLLLLLLLLPLGESFPTYLLGTESACLIELFSTEQDAPEIIMNHPIVPASETDDTTMRIQLVNQPQYPDIPTFVASLSSSDFPVTMEVMLVSDQTKDFQFVMDTTVGAHFEQGSCAGQTRIAGRSGDRVQWTLPRPPDAAVKLVAGWATSYEAVRLTPTIVVSSSSSSLGDSTTTTQQQQQQQNTNDDGDWTDFVISEIGCASVQLSEVTTTIQDIPVQKTMYKLSLNPENNQVSFAHRFEKLLMQISSSSHGAFFQGENSHCNHDRVVLTRNPQQEQQPLDPWPTIQIVPEEFTASSSSPIYIYAVFSLPNQQQNNNSNILYQTEFLKLEWEADDNQNSSFTNTTTNENSRIVDVPKNQTADGKDHPIIRISSDEHDHGGAVTGNILGAAIVSEEDHGELGRELERENYVAKLHAGGHNQKFHNNPHHEDGDRKKLNPNLDRRFGKWQRREDKGEQQEGYKQKLMVKHKKRKDAQKDMDAKIYADQDKIRAQAEAYRRRKGKEETTQGVFRVGRSYYTGIAVLVLLNGLVIFGCRKLGKQNKGRRSL